MELMDTKTRQRELVNEYSAPKDPEAQDIFLLRGLIDQFIALKKLGGDNSAMRVLKDAITQLKENPHLRTQVDEYFALLELDGEFSTLKEQTANNNPTWETEGKMVEQMESPASLRTLEALEELNNISFTLNELMDENFIPKELMDGNPRQRELVEEYSALKEPETQIIFLLRELIDQFTALKKLVDDNPHLDDCAMREPKVAITQLKEKVDENPNLRTQVEEYFALLELEGEYSTLKQQTATNNPTWETEGRMVEQMESPASLLMKCHMDLIPLTQHVESAKAKEKELGETEEIQNEQEEKFESLQDSREEQQEFRVLLNGASQSEEKSSNEQELYLKRESKQEDEIRPLSFQEVPSENDMKKEKKKQEKKEKRDKEEKKKQEKKDKQEKKKMEKMEEKKMKKIEKEKKEIEKKEKQETEKIEKRERKEMKKIEKEKNEREETTTGKWYSFCFKWCI